jgi:hypothetical protein
MKPFLLNSAALLSVLLCVATIAMWVRSQGQWDMLAYEGGDVQATLTSLDGRVQFFRRSGFPRAEPRWDVHSRPNPSGWRIDSMPGRRWYQWLGFDFRASPSGVVPRDLIIMLPYWFVALLTAMGPVGWMIRRVRRGPVSGRCARCGYDLRATPDRCPECGADATPSVTSASR